MAKRKRKLQNTKKTFTVKVPAANRNYKDTVFRMLFSNRKNLLSLYNAVNQRDYNSVPPRPPSEMISKSSLYFSFNTFFAMRTSLFVESKIPAHPLCPIIRHTMTIITVILLKFLIILHLTLHISSDNVLTLFVVSVC